MVLKSNFCFNIVFKPYNIWNAYVHIVKTPKTMRIRQKWRFIMSPLLASTHFHWITWDKHEMMGYYDMAQPPI